jgi:hypothetical protein
MFFEDAMDYLETHHNGENVAMMVVTEKEIKQVAGDRYPSEDIDRLVDLISRTPRGDDDIDSNYWYDQRGMFRSLVEAGIVYIANTKVREEIDGRNKMLAAELGLKNIQLSLDKEVRPMMVISRTEVINVYNVFSDSVPWFQLPIDSTYADLLLIIDAHKRGDGHHIYLEDIRGKINTDTDEHTLYVSFGS